MNVFIFTFGSARANGLERIDLHVHLLIGSHFLGVFDELA